MLTQPQVANQQIKNKKQKQNKKLPVDIPVCGGGGEGD